MIVLDASTVLEFLLDTEAGKVLAERALLPGEDLHAPHLLDVEVLQAIRRYAGLGDLDEADSAEAVRTLVALRIARHPHGPLLERAWELRHSLTAYDAMYVALAEALGAPLLTRDARLARSHGHRARVLLV